MRMDIRVAPHSRTAIDQALIAPYLGAEQARVLRFHQGMPGYAPTPLVRLGALAERLGLEAVYVKDESKRFGLNAFKALGGSWAAATYIARRLDIPPEELSWQKLTAPDTLKRLEGLRLVTATDGNHGRGVAWVAQQLGLPALVYMPEGTAQERLMHIRRLGAEAEILPMNYDDTRRHAERVAQELGGLLIQDTAWDDYREIPQWIMQGYVSIYAEIMAELQALGQPAPSHVFLQCGAGSFAAALAACFNFEGDSQPFTAVVEPHGANCFYLTALHHDGQLHAVRGRLDSIMAGLCVGEPSTLAWEILVGCADAFVSCPDEATRLGMRILAAPLKGDSPVISGESGAVGLGLLAAACLDEGDDALKKALRLDAQSRVLLINTEGDTDSEGYRRVLWGVE